MQSTKPSLIWMLWGLAWIAIGGCSAIEYASESDPAINLMQYKTFSISPWNGENARHVQPFIRNRIQAAVDSQMTQRGFRLVEAHADLVIHLVVLIEKRHGEVAKADYYHSGGIGFDRPFGYGGETHEVEGYDYEVGTLVIDIFDKTQKRLIWQGTAQAELTGEYARHPKHLDRLVKRIFKQLPV